MRASSESACLAATAAISCWSQASLTRRLLAGSSDTLECGIVRQQGEAKGERGSGIQGAVGAVDEVQAAKAL